MYKALNAFLYQDSMVVIEKKYIHGAKDDDFKPVRLVVSLDDIKEWSEEVELLGLEEEEEDA